MERWIMDDDEIATLRNAVAKARQDGGRVLFFDVDGRPSTVIDVPDRKLDPDNTGIRDFVALLGYGTIMTGHVDLSNAEPDSFMVAAPVFALEEVAAPRA
jgi:hypothetical protein